jgi:hypothetical protein
MPNDILNELQNTTTELIQLLSTFNQEQLNTIPFEGSWAAAQLGEHLHKSYGVAELLYGPVKSTERDPAEKVKSIKKALLNFDTKMISPDFILPEIKEYDKNTLIKSLKESVNKITTAAQTLNPEETCTAFALPGLGELTRMEWLYFIIYHTQRHVHQLKNIAEQVLDEK